MASMFPDLSPVQMLEIPFADALQASQHLHRLELEDAFMEEYEVTPDPQRGPH